MKIKRLSLAGVCLYARQITVCIDPSVVDAPSITPDAPDVLLITHAHADRMDEALLRQLLGQAEKPVTVLACEGAYERLRAMGGEHRYVLMRPHSVYSVEGVTFYAVRAEHGLTPTVGFIVDDGHKTCYAVGDTLYNYDVMDDVLDLVEDGVDCILLPMCDEDNTMHPADAADFAYELGAKLAIPLSYGVYADGVPRAFDFDNAMHLAPFETQSID